MPWVSRPQRDHVPLVGRRVCRPSIGVPVRPPAVTSSDAAVEALLAAMEPIMIVVLGVVVGGMIVAMYLPIFDMINAVG